MNEIIIIPIIACEENASRVLSSLPKVMHYWCGGEFSTLSSLIQRPPFLHSALGSRSEMGEGWGEASEGSGVMGTSQFRLRQLVGA